MPGEGQVDIVSPAGSRSKVNSKGCGLLTSSSIVRNKATFCSTVSPATSGRSFSC
jgi:hypothetical protein